MTNSGVRTAACADPVCQHIRQMVDQNSTSRTYDPGALGELGIGADIRVRTISPASRGPRNISRCASDT
jgi:hypothetical protein